MNASSRKWKSIVSYLKAHLNKSDVTHAHLNKSDVTHINKPRSFQIFNDLFTCAFRYDCVVASSHIWTSACISKSRWNPQSLTWSWRVWIRHMWHKWMSHGIHTWVSQTRISHVWISYLWFIHESHALASYVTQMNEPWHTHANKSSVNKLYE